MGVGGCDIFLGGCLSVSYFSGLLWVGATFFWVSVGGCDIFLGVCVCVGVPFY